VNAAKSPPQNKLGINNFFLQKNSPKPTGSETKKTDKKPQQTREPETAIVAGSRCFCGSAEFFAFPGWGREKTSVPFFLKLKKHKGFACGTTLAK
jgi:hypothetical protein